MTLSDFLNGCTTVSLYSRYSLRSHSVHVARKKCYLYKKLCYVNKKDMLKKYYVVHQNYVSDIKIYCGNTKYHMTPKRD